MYAEAMKKALEIKPQIIEVLNQYRTEPLDDSWWPIAVFSSFTDKDNTTILSWDGEYGITYRDNDLNKEETIDLRTTPYAKLHWRVDWPMRWVQEGVDFEPAGKDHHSKGGSFDTSKQIVEFFGGHAPVSFQYDFISIKGRGGKISSSSGEVVSLGDVLEVYTPELTRFLFASTRPNTEFAISFDLDVLKLYEDYDNCERRYFGLLPCNEKKLAMEKRVYELSQVGDVPAVMPYQIPLRHLCNLLQIHNGNIDEVLKLCNIEDESQVPRPRNRAECAWRWITTFAPEDFRFALKTPGVDMYFPKDDKEIYVLHQSADIVENLDTYDEKALAEALYAVAEKAGMDSKDMFTLFYNVLIGKEKGPRLAGFIKTCGKEKVLPLLKWYK
jgi:lysyl-tRNA synthetase class 1